jgi:nicotinamidase-related amidase
MALPTLLVIDVQQAMDDPARGERNNPDFERNLAAALTAWRESSAPIIHIRHESTDGGQFIPGTPAFEYKPEAQPIEGEPEITKNVNSAFIGTDLEDRLRADGAEIVAVAGLTTNHCCSTTARMAANLGFETWILEDALAAFPCEATDGEVITGDAIHRTELASLNGEFGEVIPVARAIERLG